MIAILLGAALLLAPTAAAQGEPDEWEDDPWGDEAAATLPIHGFVETALGTRTTSDDAIHPDATLSELRLRLDAEWARDRWRLVARGEGLYDQIVEGWEAEIRELALTVSPSSRLDLRLGRQVLTWGTGDLLFLNDLFAKDFESFFAGRTDDYLKGPENAVRLMVYDERVNVDFVWAPVFESDNFLDGERFSFFSPQAGQIVAPDPPRTLANGDFSLRLSREDHGLESAVYLHRGSFQQPTSVGFSPLQAVGASLRRSAWGGLVNGEIAWYDSVDDRDGDDPAVPNGQLRVLLGHERELARSLTGGFQYYVEWTLDHDELLAASPTPQFEADEVRHLVTQRLTYLRLQDRLRLSAFLFWSPSDGDGYLRGECSYRIDDHWSVAGGVNVFEGLRDHTFFGQLDDNDNVFIRARYGF